MHIGGISYVLAKYTMYYYYKNKKGMEFDIVL
jgi:hypothetical protein